MAESDDLCDGVATMDYGRIVGAGEPAALKAAILPDATPDGVFIVYCGAEAETEGRFRDVARTRRAIRRLTIIVYITAGVDLRFDVGSFGGVLLALAFGGACSSPSRRSSLVW